MSLVQMSFAGAVLIVVTAGIRALTLHRLPKGTFPALWAVALVRLLTPYTLPWTMSVYSLWPQKSPAVAGAAQALRPGPGGAGALPTLSLPAAPGGPVDLWSLLWLLGAVGCGLFFLAVYGKCRMDFRASVPAEDAAALGWLEEHRLWRKVSIRLSDRVSAPLTYGVLRPVILMPKTTDWSDREGLGYVLTHEYIHIRRFDGIFKLALTAAVCVHWFDPAVWLMYVLANRDLELSCDEAVVRRSGQGSAAAYAMALIRMEERRGGPAPLMSGFSKNATEERIVAIMKIKKRSMAAVAAAMLTVLGVTAAFATTPQVKAPAPAVTPAVEDAAGTEDWLWPLEGYDTVSMAESEDHAGVDIAAPEGTPVRAALAGTVSVAAYDARYGNYVLLDHGGGDTSLYSQLKDVSVSRGQQVDRGQELGTVGNTGMSTGPHLHFHLHRNDAPPAPFVPIEGNDAPHEDTAPAADIPQP